MILGGFSEVEKQLRSIQKIYTYILNNIEID